MSAGSNGPRLLLAGRTPEQLAEQARTTHVRQFRRLCEHAGAVARSRPPEIHPPASVTHIGYGVANLALAYVLTRQAHYLDAARAWIATAVGYPHWGRVFMPDHDLDAGWLLFGLSLGYDWLGAELPAAERDRLAAKIARQAGRLYRFALRTEGRWWASSYWQNHNWICHTGLAAAGLALRGSVPEAGAWLARARANFATVLSLLPADGSWHEGVVYWRYGLPWLLSYLALEAEANDGGAGLHRIPWLEQTFYYRLYLAAPGWGEIADLDDCHDRRSGHSVAAYYRLAALFGNGHAQWLAEHLSHTGLVWREAHESLVQPGLRAEAFLELLWYDPSVPVRPPTDLPPARAFPDLGLFSARTGWDDDAALLVLSAGAEGGERAWEAAWDLKRRRGWETLSAGHDHPDQNHFLLMARGVHLATDDGYCDVKQTAGHSTILVDGRGQCHEGPYQVMHYDLPPYDCRGRLEASFAGAGFAFARGEAAGAYPPDLQLDRFSRSVLSTGTGSFAICDDLSSRQPHVYQWLLQSDWPATGPGGAAGGGAAGGGAAGGGASGPWRVAAGPGALWVYMLAPEPVEAAVSRRASRANTSASTPSAVVERQQATLSIRTPAATPRVRFLAVLATADFDDPPPAVLPLAGTGSGYMLSAAGHREWAGFAGDAGELCLHAAGGRAAPRPDRPVLAAHARWAAVVAAGSARRFAAHAARWLRGAGEDWMRATGPVDIAGERRDSRQQVWVTAPAPAAVCLYLPACPRELVVNGNPQPAPAVPQVTLALPAGSHRIALTLGTAEEDAQP